MTNTSSTSQSKQHEETFITYLCEHWNLRRPGGGAVHPGASNPSSGFQGNTHLDKPGLSFCVQPSAKDSNWASCYQAGQAQFLVDNQALAALANGQSSTHRGDDILMSHLRAYANTTFTLIANGSIMPRRAIGDMVRWAPRELNKGADRLTPVRESGPNLYIDQSTYDKWKACRACGLPWALQFHSDGGFDPQSGTATIGVQCYVHTNLRLPGRLLLLELAAMSLSAVPSAWHAESEALCAAALILRAILPANEGITSLTALVAAWE